MEHFAEKMNLEIIKLVIRMSDQSRIFNSNNGEAATPPDVNFFISPNELQILFARRAVIQATTDELSKLKAEAARDMDRQAYDAQLFAGVAASWAIVLGIADAARALLSARFRAAEKAFKSIDDTAAKVDEFQVKLEKVFGVKTQPRLTKAHLVAQLGTAYEKPKKLLEEIALARDFLKKIGAKENVRVRSLLDGVNAVAEDAMLVDSALEQGRDLRRQIESVSQSTQANLRLRLQRLHQQALYLDRQIIYLFEKQLVMARTA